MLLHELPMFREYFNPQLPASIDRIGSGKFIENFLRLNEKDSDAATEILEKIDWYANLFECTRDQRARYQVLLTTMVAGVYQEAEANGGNLLPYAWYSAELLRQSDDYRLESLRNVVDQINSLASDSVLCINSLMDNLELVRCDHCNQLEYASRTETTFDNKTICRDCAANAATYLDRYDSYVFNDQLERAIDCNGGMVWVHCHDDEFEYSAVRGMLVHVEYYEEEYLPSVIGGYHSSKRSQKVIEDEWSLSLNRWLGVELEVEAIDADEEAMENKARALNVALNNGTFGQSVFFEKDGSLRCGFEIVSQPMSLPRHRQLWQWLNDRSLTRGLKSHNTTTCGLHVHVSRSGMTALHVAKIVAFINNEENENLVRSVARRYGEGYCRIKQKKIGASAQSEDRYEAVNVTGHKTIEFRIFKGSLKYESVIAAIEFSNAVVEFTRPTGHASISQLNTDSFMEFIEKKLHKETKVLRQYLKNRMEIA